MRSSGDPQSLLAAGRYAEALSTLGDLGSRRDLFIDEKILKAELLSLTGAVEPSNILAQELISGKGLSVPQRCRLRDVLATCAFRKGFHAKGMDHYSRGIELAESEGDLRSECLLRIHVLRYQNRFSGSDQPAASLTSLRRKTYQVADKVISIKFQLALSELAAKMGLYKRAHKHLEAAKSLLGTVPDRGLHAEAKIAELAVAAFESNLSDALKYAFELRTMAVETGSQAAKFAACANLGHLLCAHARYEEATFWLEQGLLEHASGGSGEVALRDTLMTLQMSMDLDASLQADVIWRLLAESANRDSYYGLWHLLTRVRWLYKSGAAEEGAALALAAIPRIERLADRNFLERIKLLAAEGLGRIGRTQEAVSMMADAVGANPDPPLEIMAEASRVAGRLAAADDTDAAFDHFDRAARILQTVGNLAARADVGRDAADTLPPALAAAVGTGQHPRAKDIVRTPAISLVERIATLVDLGSHPPLLAAETLSLIADTGAAISGAIIETRPDGATVERDTFKNDNTANTNRHPDSVRIALGCYRDGDYAVTAMPRPSAAARATLLAVERLVHTALALAHARHQEREQAALWPEHTPEQQLGLVAASEKMLDLIKTIRRVATSNITVLITGETGVGKELFARALQHASARHDRTFLPFNCTTVPKDMIESQLAYFC